MSVSVMSHIIGELRQLTGERISPSLNNGRLSLDGITCLLAVCRSSPSQKISGPCLAAAAAGLLALLLDEAVAAVLDEVEACVLARRGAAEEDEEMRCLFAPRVCSCSSSESSSITTVLTCW